MAILKHHNWKYDGGSPDIPLAVGDKLYSQDIGRDFNYLLDRAGLTLRDMLGSFPAYLSGGVVTKGAGDTLDITAGKGYAEFEVDLPDDFDVVTPPTVIQQDMDAIRIEWTQQTNMAIPSATLDGGTVNYVKVAFNDADLNDRTRKKKAGTYYYELTPSFTITVDSTPNTDKEVLLATFTGTGGGAFTITDIDPLLDIIPLKGPIGIGITTPQQNIHVHQSDSSGNRIQFTNSTTGTTTADGCLVGISDDEHAFIWNYENTNLLFATNNDTKMTILPNGSVGIGTSAPQSLVHVNRSDSSGLAIQFTNNDSGVTNTDGTVVGMDSSERTVIRNYENTDMLFYTNNQTRMTILADGKVGMGTSSPDNELHVHKSTAAFTGFRLSNSFTGETGGLLIGEGATGAAIINNIANVQMEFKTNNTERFRITNDGRLSTGIESAPDVDPGGLCLRGNGGTKLTFKSANVAHGITGYAETDTYFSSIMYNTVFGGVIQQGFSEGLPAYTIEAYSTGASTDTNTSAFGTLLLRSQKKSGTGATSLANTENLLVLKNYLTTRYIFKGDGTAYADVSWTTFSDVRLKTDIKEIEYGLNEIMQLKPKKYIRFSGGLKDGKVKKENNDRHDIGFIAQEMYEIMPEVTCPPKNDKESFWGITETKLIAPMVKAIQELKNELDDLKKDITKIAVKT